jgi:isorenieratene synthase
MSRVESLHLFGRRLPAGGVVSTLEDWQQARPQWIRNALRHAQSLPDPGWFVVDAVRAIGPKPRVVRIDACDYVVWRSSEGIHVAPEACPHMGASLAGARVCDGALVCPWHGLHLGSAGHGSWKPVPTIDDGVLLWIAPEARRRHTDAPILAPRPQRFLDAVIRRTFRCDPQDIIANRLDPWHGAHYHPYAFGRLRVIQQTDEDIVVRVVYRVGGPLGIEVDARFHCPEPRSIVMTILRGEGEGSVVETHATPIEAGRSALIEATLATSDRPPFWAAVKLFGGILRPLVQRAAGRLWVDDGAYAERLFDLRQRGWSPGRDGASAAEANEEGMLPTSGPPAPAPGHGSQRPSVPGSSR